MSSLAAGPAGGGRYPRGGRFGGWSVRVFRHVAIVHQDGGIACNRKLRGCNGLEQRAVDLGGEVNPWVRQIGILRSSPRRRTDSDGADRSEGFASF